MTKQNNPIPTIFCPECDSYLGRNNDCNCGWVRPTAQYIPKSSEPQGHSTTLIGAIRSVPLVTTNSIFVGTKGGFFYALNRNNGSIQWEKTIGKGIESSAVLYQNIVIFGTDDGTVYAFDSRSGEPAWEKPFQTDGKVQGGMTLTDGAVYFGNHMGKVFALNAQNGASLWSNPFTTIIPGAIKGTPFVTHRTLFFGNYNNNIYAINALSPKKIWEPYDTGGRIATSPIMVNNKIIITNLDGDIHAFNSSGKHLWHKNVSAGIRGTATLADGILYFGTLAGNLYALNSDGRSDPRLVYQTTKPITTSPLIMDGLIFFGANDDAVYAIDTSDNSLFWRFNTKTPILGSPAFFEGNIYIGGEDGSFFTLPWHLGQWAKAARHCQKLGHTEHAATYYALAGDENGEEAYHQSALDIWRNSDNPGRAAARMERMSRLLPEMIAIEYERSAGRIEQKNRTRATVYFLRAADFYAEANLPEKEKTCLNRAARMAALPRLKIGTVHVPEFEQGEPGDVIFDMRNFGQSAAHNIVVRFNGETKNAKLPPIIEAGARLYGIKISRVRPTTPQSRIDISYTDINGICFHLHQTLEITINRIDADIVIGKDAVANIRIENDVSTPKLHVKEGAVVNYRVKNKSEL